MIRGYVDMHSREWRCAPATAAAEELLCRENLNVFDYLELGRRGFHMGSARGLRNVQDTHGRIWLTYQPLETPSVLSILERDALPPSAMYTLAEWGYSLLCAAQATEKHRANVCHTLGFIEHLAPRKEHPYPGEDRPKAVSLQAFLEGHDVDKDAGPSQYAKYPEGRVKAAGSGLSELLQALKSGPGLPEGYVADAGCSRYVKPTPYPKGHNHVDPQGRTWRLCSPDPFVNLAPLVDVAAAQPNMGCEVLGVLEQLGATLVLREGDIGYSGPEEGPVPSSGGGIAVSNYLDRLVPEGGPVSLREYAEQLLDVYRNFAPTAMACFSLVEAHFKQRVELSALPMTLLTIEERLRTVRSW